MATAVTKVLVIDDSAYVRKVVRQMLSRSPFIEVVGTAQSGEEALEMVLQLKPDVVTLDLIMPGMGGIGFLQEQMKRSPMPVVVVSIAESTSEHVLDALDAGATDFVQKPSAMATDKMYEMADELVEKVKAASSVRLNLAPTATARADSAVVPSSSPRFDAIVVGVSTGGPQALKQLIPRFPVDFPIPIAIVLHMPLGYTGLYAERLGDLSQLRVLEARHGDPFEPGVVYIAPAGRHLKFYRNPASQVALQLDAMPFDTIHRPSVDVMFRSAAEAFGSRLLGVLMTGMGTDGKEGASWIKAKGGTIFTEAEESCVVYGMPRAVAEAGLSDRVVSLPRMAEAIFDGVWNGKNTDRR